MFFHAYGIWDFSQHPKEMFVPHEENLPCYLFIYFMVYILPMVTILASRFFFLCWWYPYRGMELVYYQGHGGLLLYSYDCNWYVLSLWLF